MNKLDAANRQLDFAIHLLFSGGDSVCIHTLAGAASILLSDLVEHHAPSKSWDRAAQESNRLSPGQYFGITRNAQNFLKHAKSDPAAILNFDEVETEELIMLSVMNSGELQDLSIHQSVYQLWYLGARATTLGDDFPFVKDALELFPGVNSMARADQRMLGARVLADALVAQVPNPSFHRTLRDEAAQRR
jgi:hypothetical protein